MEEERVRDRILGRRQMLAGRICSGAEKRSVEAAEERSVRTERNRSVKIEAGRFGGAAGKMAAICLILAIFAVGALVSAGIRSGRRAYLQQGISREVLRFHVLANSDREEDQQVKLQVRDGVLEWLETKLSKEEQENRSRMEERIRQLLPEIEKRAEAILAENGFDYGVRAELGTSRFPEKTYGDCTFPAGRYMALRILLGEAKGQNWWCVLFPRLCFLDCVHAVVPEESRRELEQILTEEEYDSLFDPERDSYKICFRYF